MNIIRASHLGMCFGVRDAIDLAFQTAVQPVSVLGDLVHNETVLSALRQRGVRIVHNVAEAHTQNVIITAHGASQKAIAGAHERGHRVLEATCPLVRSAHRAVARLVRDGYHPVIVGKRDHVEVRGITEDLQDFDVVLTEAEVFELEEHSKFGVAAQTTQRIEKVRYLVGLLRWRFPQSEVCFIDTVCHPTKERQRAAIELATESDVVIVIGGQHSNNTHELVKTCAQHCDRVYHVQTADDLRAEWLESAETVGITAGTSTPDSTIEAVEMRLNELAAQAGPSRHTAMISRPEAGVELIERAA